MFFCGGTGILPFLDTFAYVLRKKLAQYEKGLTLFNDEKFDDLAGNFVLSVYCFFQTKASSIGIEILEMLK